MSPPWLPSLRDIALLIQQMTGGSDMPLAAVMRKLLLRLNLHPNAEHGIVNRICAGPFPYESNLAASSIQFGMSTQRQFDGTSIKEPTQTDWSVGFVEHSGDFSDHHAISWVRYPFAITWNPVTNQGSRILKAFRSNTPRVPVA